MRTILILLSAFMITSYSRGETKQQAIERLRDELSSLQYDVDEAYNDSVWQLLDETGRFTDLRSKENEIIEGGYTSSSKMSHCTFINNVTDEAFSRLNKLTCQYRGKNILSLIHI